MLCCSVQVIATLQFMCVSERYWLLYLSVNHIHCLLVCLPYISILKTYFAFLLSSIFYYKASKHDITRESKELQMLKDKEEWLV